MTKKEIEQKIIEAGVKNLHDFGYLHATKENILTDEIYKEMFKSMLNDNLGNGEQVDQVIYSLLDSI